MKISIALIVIAFVLLRYPRLNARVDVWVKNVPYVNRVRAPAATLIGIVGLFGLLTNLF